jgi:hypothetical protein
MKIFICSVGIILNPEIDSAAFAKLLICLQEKL